MALGANGRSREIPSVPVRAASQRSAERTAPSISAVGTRDIITPVGVGKVAIRTAAPCVDSLRVKVVRSDLGELSLNNLVSSAHSRSSRVSRSACAAGGGDSGLVSPRQLADHCLSCAQSSGRYTHHLSAFIRSGSQVQCTAGED